LLLALLALPALDCTSNDSIFGLIIGVHHHCSLLPTDKERILAPQMIERTSRRTYQRD
jgi:hypothetical protein